MKPYDATAVCPKCGGQEFELSATPVVCGPDGARCAWMKDAVHRVEVLTGMRARERDMLIVFPDGCPVCRGRFRREGA